MPLNRETPVQTTPAPANPLSRAFFSRDVVEVAQACLGLTLESQTTTGLTRGRIVEVEAYRGPDDRAAHSFGGRRTARTEVMFGLAGHAYVFLIYGIHTHLNIVTGNVGQPQAVLIRAIEPLTGVDLMYERRARSLNGVDKKKPPPHALCNGPGKLCQALDISRRFNGADLLSDHAAPNSEYLLLTPGSGPKEIACSPRIGVDYAGDWAATPWRFFDPNSAFVSRARRGTIKRDV